jgi:peptidoglycan/LPS O-acetylase OafA/YrhL
MSLFMLLSMAVTMYAQWACFWYLSQPSFVAGMIVSAYEERLKKILCRYSFAVIFLILLIPILSLPNGSFFTARTFGLIIYTNFFPFGVLFMLYAYNPIRSKAIRYLGKISLEIYLVHGLVLFVVYKIGLLCGCSRLPWYAFVALTFILTIPIAAVAHQFNQKVASWFYDQQ